jgi:hypothetical protein
MLWGERMLKEGKKTSRFTDSYENAETNIFSLIRIQIGYRFNWASGTRSRREKTILKNILILWSNILN